MWVRCRAAQVRKEPHHLWVHAYRTIYYYLVVLWVACVSIHRYANVLSMCNPNQISYLLPGDGRNGIAVTTVQHYQHSQQHQQSDHSARSRVDPRSFGSSRSSRSGLSSGGRRRLSADELLQDPHMDSAPEVGWLIEWLIALIGWLIGWWVGFGIGCLVGSSNG